MKRLTRILTVAAGAAVAVIAAAPHAAAICATPQTLSHWNGPLARYAYINGADPSSSSATMIGKYWQQGQFALANNGAYGDENWLKQFGEQWYTDAQMESSVGSVGCPGGAAVLFIENNVGSRTQILVQSVAKDPTQAVVFDFSAEGDVSFVDVPRPNLGNRQVSGNLRNFTVSVPPVALPNSAAGLVQFQIRTAAGTATVEPGRAAAAYTNAGPVVPAGGNAPLSFDCTVPQTEYFVGAQLVVDGQASSLVGATTRVTCNPALADPKFKPIDRPSRPANPRRDR